MMIEITSPEWTIEEMAAGWADDETLAAEQITDCADTEAAWLVNHTGEYLPGWGFAHGTFSGPARSDAITEIMSLFVLASDYVIEHMDEICGEDDEAA
jgi:hypothetical protein